MRTIAEITKVAEQAINEAYAHYFTNLTTGDNKQHEATFVAQVILLIQPWLFFTEDSLVGVQDAIYKDTIYVNFVYNMTAMFRQRLVLENDEYQKLLDHIAASFHTQECENQIFSLMPYEYIKRLHTPDVVTDMLKNNRPLVMIACTFLYLDTSIITQSFPPHK